MPKIVIKKKTEILREYLIDKKSISIGRSEENDIILEDKAISEKHCIIRFIKDKFEVEDLDTAFGTVINGERIRKKEVNIGAQIRLGSYLLAIRPISDKESAEEGTGASGKQAYLLGIQGKMEGKKYELNPDITKIGRSDEFNDIWISKKFDKSVSRRHATITCKNEAYVLTDKRSKNRTFVNQRQVGKEDEIVIKNRDEILIGKSIFRFILGEKEDYSHPSKAGVFWVRFFYKFKKVIAVLMLLGIIYLMYKGFWGLSIVGAKPSKVDIKKLQWKPEGLTYSQQGYLVEGIDTIPSPAIGDINGDKNIEVVISNTSGKVYAWQGSTGRLLWFKSIGNHQLTSPVLADINNDEILDVIIGSDDSRVYVLDGISGELIYMSDFLGGKILSASSPLVKDLDEDGFNDIVITTDDRVVCFLFSPGLGSHKPYFFRTPEDILSSPVFLRDNRGSGSVVVGTNGGKLYIFNAANPESREVVDITRKINMLKGINLVLNEISSIPAVADLDGDGVEDLIFTTSAYYIVALNGASHSILWAYKIQPYSTLDSPKRSSSPSITEFSKDGVLAVAVGWENGRVMALDGRTGELLWKYSVGEDSQIISSVAIADFNKDKLMDFIFINKSGKILLVKGGKHAQGDTLLGSYSIGKSVTATPCIGDINGDGYLEMLITAVDGTLHMLTTTTRVFKNELFWVSFRRNAQNSGSLYSYLGKKTGIFMSYIGVAGASLLGGFLMILIKRKMKLKKRPKVIRLK